MPVSPRPATRGGSGPPSQILHASARRHHFSGTGALSVKTFRHGQAHYRVGRGGYTMGENSYLVLNHGHPYTLDIDAPQSVDSFCLFFAPELMADAQRNLALTTIRLLDEPAPASPARINFFERIYPSDTFLTQLNSFRKALPAHRTEPGWLDAQWHALATGLLATHRRECRLVETLPALRAATREELYRRLHRARDYALSRFDQPLTLNELSSIACLSPNHFLRTFKQAFHETPHQSLPASASMPPATNCVTASNRSPRSASPSASKVPARSARCFVGDSVCRPRNCKKVIFEKPPLLQPAKLHGKYKPPSNNQTSP